MYEKYSGTLSSADALMSNPGHSELFTDTLICKKKAFDMFAKAYDCFHKI